ncbi:MAG TPA: hypothetical protein VIM61_00430 [Chthoniobacterales bacterium]
MPPVTKIGKNNNKDRIEWKRPFYDYTLDGTTAKIEATGLYEALRRNLPSLAAAHPKVAGGLTIARITLEPGQSNEGKMTLYFSGPPATPAGGDDAIYERDWGTESRPIERHPKCPNLKEDRPYYEFPDKAYNSTSNPRFESPDDAGDKTVAQRTWDHWAALDVQDVNGGTWSLSNYKSLKESGWNDYEHVFPIARATTYTAKRPNGATSILNVEAPPSSCGVPSGGWTYFKAADRSTRENGRFRQSKEWEGRRGSDATLYGLVYG